MFPERLARLKADLARDGCKLEHVEVALAYLMKQEGGYPDALRRKARIVCYYFEQRNLPLTEDALARECPFEFVDFVFRLKNYQEPMQQLARWSHADLNPLLNALESQNWDAIGQMEEYPYQALEALRRGLISCEACATILLYWSFVHEYGPDGFEVITDPARTADCFAHATRAEKKSAFVLDARAIPEGGCLFVTKERVEYPDSQWDDHVLGFQVQAFGPYLCAYDFIPNQDFSPYTYGGRAYFAMYSPQVLRVFLRQASDASFGQWMPAIDWHLGQDLWCDREAGQRRMVPRLAVGVSFPGNIRPTVHDRNGDNLASTTHDISHAFMYATAPYHPLFRKLYKPLCSGLDRFLAQHPETRSIVMELYWLLMVDYDDSLPYQKKILSGLVFEKQETERLFVTHFLGLVIEKIKYAMKDVQESVRQELVTTIFSAVKRSLPELWMQRDLWIKRRDQIAGLKISWISTSSEAEQCFFPLAAIMDEVDQLTSSIQPQSRLLV